MQADVENLEAVEDKKRRLQSTILNIMKGLFDLALKNNTCDYNI